MRSRWKAKGWMILVGVAVPVVAFWWGYAGERRVMDGAGQARSPMRSVVRRLTTPAHERAGLEKLEELRQAMGRKSPSALEQAALWRMVRAFSAAEAEAALDEVLAAGLDRSVNVSIAEMLAYRWGEEAPDLAMEWLAGVEERFRGGFQHSVLTAWANRDPEAMRRWALESTDDQVRKSVIYLSAKKWCFHDPESALAKAAAEFPEAKTRVLQVLGSRAAYDSRSLKVLIDAVVDDPSLRAGQQSFLFGVSQAMLDRDGGELEHVLEELEVAGVDVDDLAKIRSSMEKSQRYQRMVSDESFEMAESLRYVSEAATPQARARSFANAADAWPDEAIAWATSRGESELIAGAAATRADDLLKNGWIPNASHRSDQTDGLLRCFATWKRIDPRGAADWLGTLPGDAAIFLNSSSIPDETQ